MLHKRGKKFYKRVVRACMRTCVSMSARERVKCKKCHFSQQREILCTNVIFYINVRIHLEYRISLMGSARPENTMSGVLLSLSLSTLSLSTNYSRR